LHGELIKAGKVEKLTYRQLHRLEKLDVEKEREKLLLGAPATAIYSAGEITRTTIDGVFGILKAIAGNDNPISQAVAIAGLAVGFELFLATYPELAKLLGLDRLGWRPGTGPARPPSTGPGSPTSGAPNPPQVIVPTGRNIFSLPQPLLDEAAKKAAAGDVFGCIHEITAAGGDNISAIQYCANSQIGAGQA
jgi:hypothetical protein